MSDAATKFMTVDEFLAWGEGRAGRWELHDGAPVAMSPERAAHVRTKRAAANSLDEAIGRSSLPCEAWGDGMTVRVSEWTAFEPDATVVCGGKVPGNALELPGPIIVVEVLSPSTEAFDRGEKMEGYFSLPSVVHYLILDPQQRRVVHHERGAGDLILTRILASGTLQLDPPGLEVTVESLLGAD